MTTNITVLERLQVVLAERRHAAQGTRRTDGDVCGVMHDARGAGVCAKAGVEREGACWRRPKWSETRRMGPTPPRLRPDGRGGAALLARNQTPVPTEIPFDCLTRRGEPTTSTHSKSGPRGTVIAE